MTTKQKVIEWAADRGLLGKNSDKQLIKFFEESTELAKAHLKQDEALKIDAIGDIQVVLLIYCAQNGLDFDDCLEVAYNEIKDRKGKTICGTFIKESDLS